MATLEFFGIEGDTVSHDLFGGTVLADWTDLDAYAAAIEQLGVTTLRYPGGSRTEYYFDIKNPDADTVVHATTGETKSYVPISEFFLFARQNGHSVTIVIPTRDQLSNSIDELGHRSPQIEEEALRLFVRETVTGHYGEVTIDGFEIGNEYWGSGEMDTVEYGRLASEMSKIISDELDSIFAGEEQSEAPKVLIQMGNNHGHSNFDDIYEGRTIEELKQDILEKYDVDLGEDLVNNGGSINWTYLNNEILVSFFDEPVDIEAIDGLIAHIYSLGEYNEWTRYFDLAEIEKSWLLDYPELEVHVTEWNQKGVTSVLSRDEDYGVFQAKEMLNLIEEFVRFGVDAAQVWPLLNNVDNALNFGFDVQQTNVPSAFFGLMAENLPGKALLDLEDSWFRETEAGFDGYEVHGFAESGELLLFVTSTDKYESSRVSIDIEDLVQTYNVIELTHIHSADTTMAGSNSTLAEVTTSSFSSSQNSSGLSFDLNSSQISMIRVGGVSFEDELKEYFPDIEAASDLSESFSDIHFAPSNFGISRTQEGTSLSDILVADEHNGQLIGRGGDDVLHGNELDNDFKGGWGNDQIFGKDGDDLLVADRGDDTLDGGNGRDFLVGGAGNDKLFGGSDADTFLFQPGDGDDRIFDLSIFEDVVQLDASAQYPEFDILEGAEHVVIDQVQGIKLSLWGDDSLIIDGVTDASKLIDLFEFV